MLNLASPETVTHRTWSSGDRCATFLRDIWGPIRGVLNRNISFASAASRLLLEILPASRPMNLEGERTCVPEPLTGRDWAEILEFQPLPRLGFDEEKRLAREVRLPQPFSLPFQLHWSKKGMGKAEKCGGIKPTEYPSPAKPQPLLKSEHRSRPDDCTSA